MTTERASEIDTLIKHPLRRDDVDVHELGGEAVIFDPVNGALHRLDAAAWSIWQRCDGTHSVESIAKRFATCRGVGLDDAAAVVNKTLGTFAAQELLRGGVDVDSDLGESPPVKSSVANSALHPTRRDVLRGGAAKIVLAAPIISTFFVRPAYASTVSPHGAGGCKNVGFSCAQNQDCCGNETLQTACQDSACCVETNQPGCQKDEDCCGGDECIAGTCLEP